MPTGHHAETICAFPFLQLNPAQLPFYLQHQVKYLWDKNLSKWKRLNIVNLMHVNATHTRDRSPIRSTLAQSNIPEDINVSIMVVKIFHPLNSSVRHERRLRSPSNAVIILNSFPALNMVLMDASLRFNNVFLNSLVILLTEGIFLWVAYVVGFPKECLFWVHSPR